MRLGDSTQESHRRLQSAVDELWRFTGELFDQDSSERKLVADGVAVDTRALEADWNQTITSTMSKISIEIPKDELQVTGGREGKHTEFLGFLLSELQFLQRAYPGLEW